MTATYDVKQLELVRSDMGDGGWSIHVRRTDVDEREDPQGAWPIVLSDGDGGAWDEDEREWARPNEQDWDEARRRAAALAGESGQRI